MQSLKMIENGMSVETTQLASAFSILTPAQIANLASTNKLSEGNLRAALTASTLTDEQKAEVWSHYNVATAKGVDAAATGVLNFSLKAFTAALWENIKALGVWLTTNPVGWAVLFIGTLYAIVKATEAFTTSAEEHAEAMRDFQSQNEQAISEIQRLESELDNVKSRLDDLNELAATGRITPDQEDELSQLKEKNAELERELAIQKKLAEQRQKDTEQEAVETYKATSYSSATGKTQDVVSYEGVILTETAQFQGVEQINDLVAAMQRVKDEQEKIKQSWDNGEISADDYMAKMAELQAEYDQYDAEAARVAGEQQEIANAIYSTSGANYDLKQLILSAIDAWLALSNSSETASGDVKQDVEEMTNKVYSFAESLDAITSHIGALSKALGEFRDNKIVSASTIKDLEEVFGELEGFEKFANIVGNSDSTFTEVQSAVNSLAAEYVNSTGFLDGLNESTKEMTISQLEHIGVTNAEEVVTQRLAAKMLEAKIASAGLANATWADVEALLQEQGASKKDISALHALRLEKYNAKVASTDFATASSSVISSLIAEAQAAGVAANSIAALTQMLELKQRVESGNLSSGASRRMGNVNKATGKTGYQEQLDRLAKQAQADLSALDTTIAIPNITVQSPKSSSSKSSGDALSKEIEKTKNAFQEVYNEKKHLVDMDKMTLEDFYAWLNGENGYKKYFSDLTKYADEYRKYEKEVFDGLRQIHEDYIEDLGFEIDMLERQDGAETQVIAKLREKQAAYRQLLLDTEAYLRAAGMSEEQIARNDLVQEYTKAMYSVEDSIRDVEERLYEDSRDKINDLIDLTEDMVKQEKEDMIDALEAQKDAYSNLISQRKELLQLAQREKSYADEVADKNKEIQKLQSRIEDLSLDDSRTAAIEKAKLQEELATLQKELADKQNDHYVETTEDALDKELKEFESTQDKKIDAIQAFLKDNEALNRESLKRLDNMNQELFNNLERYAMKYTDTTREELVGMWNEAARAAEKYGSVTNAKEVFSDSDSSTAVQSILQQMKANGNKWTTAKTDAERKQYADANLVLGAKLKELLGKDVYRDGNGVWWIGNQKLFTYHSGTPNVGGQPTLKQNEVFAKLEKGESVITPKHQSAITRLLSFFDPVEKVAKAISANQFSQYQFAGAGGPNVNVTIPLTLYGDMTAETMRVLKDHRREVADVVSKVLK